MKPQWQLAKIAKKDNVHPLVRGKLVWVLAEKPEETMAYYADTHRSLGIENMYTAAIFAFGSPDQRAGVSAKNVELQAIFATNAKIFPDHFVWLNADNKTIFEMGTLTDEITYEDFERTLSH